MAQGDPHNADDPVDRHDSHNSDPVHAFTSAWEYDCCGDLVTVGDELTLDHIPYQPRAAADNAFDGVLDIDWYAGHHTTADEPGASRTRVRVLRLWEAYADLDYRGDLRSYVPMAGTARLVPVRDMVRHRDTRSAGSSPATAPAPSPAPIPTPPARWSGYHLGWVLQLVPLED